MTLEVKKKEKKEEKEEEEGEEEWGGWQIGEKRAVGFTVTKCWGQAGCVAVVLISEACRPEP